MRRGHRVDHHLVDGELLRQCCELLGRFGRCADDRAPQPAVDDALFGVGDRYRLRVLDQINRPQRPPGPQP